MVTGKPNRVAKKAAVNDDLVVVDGGAVVKEGRHSKIKIINRKGELITEMVIGRYVAVELESNRDKCNVIVMVE